MDVVPNSIGFSLKQNIRIFARFDAQTWKAFCQSILVRSGSDYL